MSAKVLVHITWLASLVNNLKYKQIKIASISLAIFLFLGCYPESPKPSVAEFHLNYSFELDSVDYFKARIALPSTLQGIQVIDSITIHPKPSRITQNNNQKYAEFMLMKPKSQILNIDLQVHFNPQNGVDLQKHYLDKSTSPEKHLEFDQTDELPKFKAPLRLQQIHQYVQQFMTPTDFQQQDQGLLGLLKTRQGDCSEYSDLSVSLCRAHDIPAWSLHGYVRINQEAIPHSWAQCDQQWMDPLLNQSLEDQPKLSLVLSTERNPKFLRGKRFLYYEWSQGRVKLLKSPQAEFKILDLP